MCLTAKDNAWQGREQVNLRQLITMVSESIINTCYHRSLSLIVALIFSALQIALPFTVNAQQDSQSQEPKPVELMPATIADDEVVQFFRTAAVFNPQSETWRVPIHAWVYEPQKSRFRKAVFSWALNAKYQLRVGEEHFPHYDRRLNLLIADNERGKTPVIEIAGQRYALPPSAGNGHIRAEFSLPNSTVQEFQRNDLLTFTAKANNGQEFHGQVQLLRDEGLSVISDIDDTIKISEVLDHQRLVDNTFLKPFVAVPGMSEAYHRLTGSVTAFHFVSSSPWQLYAPLQELADTENFPWATFSLKAIRFRDMTLFDLFKPGTVTKPLQIDALLKQFPNRRFILIGDSGEQDPEVYAAMDTTNPDQIARIFIRNITNETLNNQRFKPLVENSAKWHLFTDPVDIRL
jgi:hypothetical protein